MTVAPGKAKTDCGTKWVMGRGEGMVAWLEPWETAGLPLSLYLFVWSGGLMNSPVNKKEKKKISGPTATYTST